MKASNAILIALAAASLTLVSCAKPRSGLTGNAGDPPIEKSLIEDAAPQKAVLGFLELNKLLNGEFNLIAPNTPVEGSKEAQKLSFTDNSVAITEIKANGCGSTATLEVITDSIKKETAKDAEGKEVLTGKATFKAKVVSNISVAEKLADGTECSTSDDIGVDVDKVMDMSIDASGMNKNEVALTIGKKTRSFASKKVAEIMNVVRGIVRAL
jgi:hypothetical protein